MGRLLGIIVVVWLLIGVVAAAQRGYFGDNDDVSCKEVRRHRSDDRGRTRSTTSGPTPRSTATSSVPAALDLRPHSVCSADASIAWSQ